MLEKKPPRSQRPIRAQLSSPRYGIRAETGMVNLVCHDGAEKRGVRGEHSVRKSPFNTGTSKLFPFREDLGEGMRKDRFGKEGAKRGGRRTGTARCWAESAVGKRGSNGPTQEGVVTIRKFATKEPESLQGGFHGGGREREAFGGGEEGTSLSSTSISEPERGEGSLSPRKAIAREKEHREEEARIIGKGWEWKSVGGTAGFLKKNCFADEGGKHLLLVGRV